MARMAAMGVVIAMRVMPEMRSMSVMSPMIQLT
jgi:hypothetical protein